MTIPADEADQGRGPTARTLALLSLLQSHRLWKGSELAERLGVSHRTVRRDVDRLRALGYPVDAEAGVDGGYRLAVGAHVPPLVIDDDEAVALFVGLHSAAVSSLQGIEEATVSLLAKVGHIMPDRLRRRVDALTVSVQIMGWPNTDQPVPVGSLTVISQGCRDHEQIRFAYRTRSDDHSDRLVEPHQLVVVGRRWYLVAWDLRRDDWRTFRVDRMHDPRLAGTRFVSRPIPTGDAAAFVAQGFHTLSSKHDARVVVSATPVELDGLAHWFGVTFEPIDERRCQATLSAETVGWLAAMIAIIAVDHDIDVVDAPTEVRHHLDQAAQRLTARRRKNIIS